ncbi:MAG TPA: START-like domain-containing protein [Anseongella sp.]
MQVKKMFKMEFELRSSPKILFSFLSSPNGLAQWFADDVIVQPDDVFIFKWDNEMLRAKLLGIKENRSIKFKWEEDEPHCYFEMEVIQDELTGDVALTVTDFSVDEEKDERQRIWESQVETLIRVLGA